MQEGAIAFIAFSVVNTLTPFFEMELPYRMDTKTYIY
jgi:hypothetical protein